MPLRPLLTIGIAVLALLISSPITPAQDTPQPTPAQDPQPPSEGSPVAALLRALTLESVRAALVWLDSEDPDALALPDSVRASARDSLSNAKSALEQAQLSLNAIQEHDAAIAEAPARLQALRTELAAPAEPVQIEISPDTTIPQIEQSIAQARAALDAARAEVDRINSVRSNRESRRTQIPAEITAARNALDLTKRELDLPAPEAQPPTLTTARRAMLLAQQRQFEADIIELERELQRYDARRELLPAQLELAQRAANRQTEVLNRWQAALAAARTAEAERAAREAERLEKQAARYAQTIPALQKITEEITQLTASQTQLSQNLQTVENQQTRVLQQIQSIQNQYASIRERIERVGLTDYISASLRSSLRTLPDVASIRRQSLVARTDISRAELDAIIYRDRRVQLPDNATVIADLIAALPQDAQPWQIARVEAIARETVQLRRNLLQELEVLSDEYSDRLIELAEQENALIRLVESYTDFIEERILWVRSIPGGRLPQLDEVIAGAKWLFASPQWIDVPGAMFRQITRHPATAFLAVVIVGALILGARRARAILQSTASQVTNWRTDSFKATLAATLATAILALPIPAVIYIIAQLLRTTGIQLGRTLEYIHVAEAAGSALIPIAAIVLAASLVWHITRQKGLAEVHFRWQRAGLGLVRANLLWLIPSVLPLVFWIAALQQQNVDAYFESLGRLAFVLAMLLLALFFFRVFHPNRALLQPYYKRREDEWIGRARWIFFVLMLAFPIFSATLALLGYFYTALALEERIQLSIAIIFGFVVLNALLLRWLFIARRRVAIENARRAREAAAESSSSPLTPDESSVPIDEDQINIPALDEQTRRLFRAIVLIGAAAALYVVWSDALPALRMLQLVQIYPDIRIVEYQQPSRVEIRKDLTTTPSTNIIPPGLAPQPAQQDTADTAAAPAADTTAPDAETPPRVRVTLAHVGGAIIILVLTVLAARNLPGLLEFSLLSRLPLDNGTKYAITTIARYFIVIVGSLFAFGAINIGWSQVQWLAAALTFGLAFGLQEIFANFVSGLIILIERPIRVGDVVTVGDISGRVSRIQMRSTTITDWDRKELIIPNKSFITDRVVNWTLSDQVTRITLNVGIAYGSDTALAYKLLHQAAGEHPHVMKDPEPFVVFNQFGDNSLNFTVFAFVPALQYRFQTMHELNMRIDQLFREAGISIAFPQRDIHIDSLSPIEIKLVRDHADKQHPKPEPTTPPVPPDPAA